MSVTVELCRHSAKDSGAIRVLGWRVCRHEVVFCGCRLRRSLCSTQATCQATYEHQRHLETVCMDVVLCFGRGLVMKLRVPHEAVRRNAHLKRHRGATYRPLVRPTPYAGDTKCCLHTNDSKCTGHTASCASKRKQIHRHSGGWEIRHFLVKRYPPATGINEKYCAQPFLVSAWEAASGTGVLRWDQHRDTEGPCLRRRSAGGSEGQVWLDSGRAAFAAAGRGFAGLWALQLRLGGLAEPIPQVHTLCWEVQLTLFASQLTQHRTSCVPVSVSVDCGAICSMSATASSMLPGLYGSAAGVCGIGTDLHSHNASSRMCFSGYAAKSMLGQELQLNFLTLAANSRFNSSAAWFSLSVDVQGAAAQVRRGT